MNNIILNIKVLEIIIVILNLLTKLFFTIKYIFYRKKIEVYIHFVHSKKPKKIVQKMNFAIAELRHWELSEKKLNESSSRLHDPSVTNASISDQTLK